AWEPALPLSFVVSHGRERRTSLASTFRPIPAEPGLRPRSVPTGQNMHGAGFAICGSRTAKDPTWSCHALPTAMAERNRSCLHGIRPDTCTTSSTGFESMLKLNLAVLALICLMAGLARAQGEAPGIAQKMEATCARACHGPSLIAQQRLDVAGWTREVN